MSLFHFKTVLLVVVLISLREILRVLHGEGSVDTKVFSSLRWRSRGILQQETEYSTSDSKSSAVKCSHVISVYNSSLICHYVKTTPDCQLSDGFVQYLYLPYCLLSRNYAIVILAIWLIYLFVVLGVTADDYFCPSLAVIVKTLKMSQNVAGVTFLAYGNGAPDIFSTIAAFSHDQDNSAAELGLQGLLGAGVFVTTVVVGIISLCTPNGFAVTNRPFTRDILFYIATVGWIVIALYNQRLSMLESIGLIVLYVIYVIVVVVGRSLYQYWKRRNRTERTVSANYVNGNVSVNVVSSVLGSTPSIAVSSTGTQDEKKPLIRPVHTLHKSIPPGKKLLYGILPFTCSDLEQSGLFGKIFMVFKAPVVFLLNITVPIIDYTEPNQKWNKWLNVIHCITGPVFVVMAIKVSGINDCRKNKEMRLIHHDTYFITDRLGTLNPNVGTMKVASHFPVWALILSIGILLAVVVATLTSSNTPPRFHWMFGYLAFVVAMVWIYITTNEIVNLLQTFGVVFHLSDAILGLTFLAWGTSIGELVANTTMARKGFPNMAASACFGGTLLNLLLGIGIACTLVAARQGSHSVVLPHRYNQYIISSGFLMLSLASSGIIIPLMGFRITRLYGVYLLVIYFVYLTLSIIAEVKHI